MKHNRTPAQSQFQPLRTAAPFSLYLLLSFSRLRRVPLSVICDLSSSVIHILALIIVQKNDRNLRVNPTNGYGQPRSEVAVVGASGANVHVSCGGGAPPNQLGLIVNPFRGLDLLLALIICRGERVHPVSCASKHDQCPGNTCGSTWKGGSSERKRDCARQQFESRSTAEGVGKPPFSLGVRVRPTRKGRRRDIYTAGCQTILPRSARRRARSCSSASAQ